MVRRYFQAQSQECWYLEGQLSTEGELVPLKQATADVVEGGEGDAVDEGVHPPLDVVRGHGLAHSLVKHHIKRLRRKRRISGGEHAHPE